MNESSLPAHYLFLLLPVKKTRSDKGCSIWEFIIYGIKKDEIISPPSSDAAYSGGGTGKPEAGGG